MATEVGTAYVTLVPSAKGFAGKMQAGLSGEVAAAGTTAGTQFSDSMGKSSKGRLRGVMSGVMGSLKGLAGPLAAAAGVAAAGKFLGDSISAASDLNETISKSGQIFGKQALPELKRFASGAATAMGQSKTQALDAASQFAVFGKSAGMTGDDLVGFSTKFTGLASDLASFNNTSPQEAIDAIGAALRGESEPIRKYGVLLDDASLRQEALKQGLIKTTKEALTPQQKVLASQALIYKQTKDAQGDFARTSGGLANQQRIAAAQMDNLKSTIGQAFLPLVTKVLLVVNKLLPKLSQWGQTLSRYVGPALQTVAHFIGSFIDRLHITSAATSDASSDIKGILTDLVGIVRVIVKVLTWLWSKFGDDIMHYVVGTFQNIITIIRAALKIIHGVLDVVLGLLTGDWARAWRGVKEILSGVWTIIKTIVRQAALYLRTILSLAWKLIKIAASAAWKGIVNVIRAYIRLWIKIVTGVPNLVRSALSNLGSVLVSIMRAAFSRARSFVQGAVQDIVEAVRALPGKLRALGGALASAGQAIITAFINGLRGGGGFVSDIAGNVWNALQGMINTAIDHINSALEFTVNPPGPGSVTINPPDISHLASGGRATSATLAIIGEGREPETVLPDSMLRGLLERHGGGGFPSRVTLVVDGYEFGAYVDARADDRVGAADDLAAERGRASWAARS